MKLSAPIYRLKRQAKLQSRENSVPLHTTLNSIAKREGFKSWSQLSACHAQSSPAPRILAALAPGDLVLLGARPGHGKTLLGLELVTESITSGNRGVFFSLENTEKEVASRLEALGAGVKTSDDALMIDTSEEICADYIISRLSTATRGSVVVMDYLQLLDQDRSKPSLETQILSLKSFANAKGIIIILISQIDRRYDSEAKSLPEISDIRLPNPLDLHLFTKAVFLNNGEVSLQAVA